MKRRLLYLAPTLVGLGLLISGCGTTGSSPSLTGFDSNNPQTFLAGAEVDQAKSIAMGSAVTKGWKIVESSDNTLVVSRSIDPATASTAVGRPVAAASAEVTTRFRKQRGGVNVEVSTVLVADKGTKAQERIDFTSSYRDELNRSLGSLERSWEANRWRVASATPPLPKKIAAPGNAATEVAPSADEGTQIADAATEPGLEDDSVAALEKAPLRATAPVTASQATEIAAPVEDIYATTAPLPPIATNTAAARSEPIAPPPIPAGIAPVEARTTPAPPTLADSTPADPSENMLVLDRTAELGVWAYYAEYYARIRGCDVSDPGAVLEAKQPEQEIHRVYCDDGRSIRVSCSAGTCRGIE